MTRPDHTLGDLTRTAVLAALGRSGPLSRAELARVLDVSPATVTAVTRRLVAEGLVQELDEVATTRGRPARPLRLAQETGSALGVKVTLDRVVGVRVRLDGQVVDGFEEPFDARAAGAVDRLCELLRARLVGRAGAAGLLGVGIGVPGIVDVASGGAVRSPMLGWDGVPLGSLLQRALELPVLVDNDVNTVAVAERLYGRGRELSDFLVVTIGRGVGLGVILDGALYRGAGGAAGEFGHTPLDGAGPTCDCGNRGCLEAYIGDDALLAAARERQLVDSGDGPERLAALADGGHPEATAIFAAAGERLGRAVAGLVNVLNPASVLVAGEGTRAWRHWLPGFGPTLRAHLFPPLRTVPFDVEPWDDQAWAQGAAALVLAAPFAGTLDGRQPVELVRARFAEVTAPAATAARDDQREPAP